MLPVARKVGAPAHAYQKNHTTPREPYHPVFANRGLTRRLHLNFRALNLKMLDMSKGFLREKNMNRKIIITSVLLATACLFAGKTPETDNPLDAKFKSHKARLARVEYTSAIKLAEKKYHRELEELQKQRDKTIKAAREKFISCLEEEKLAVMKDGDLDEAIRLRDAAAALKKPLAQTEQKASIVKSQEAAMKKIAVYSRVFTAALMEVRNNEVKRWPTTDKEDAEARRKYGGAWMLYDKTHTKEQIVSAYAYAIGSIKRINRLIEKHNLEAQTTGIMADLVSQLASHERSLRKSKKLPWSYKSTITTTKKAAQMEQNLKILISYAQTVKPCARSAGRIKLKTELPR